MAWRDYSETNYGYDAYDEKNYGNAMPMTATANYHTSSGYHTYQSGINGNGNGYGHHPATNMSLPRPQQMHHNSHHNSSRHNGNNSSAMGVGNGAGGGGGGGGASAANPGRLGFSTTPLRK